LGGAVLMPPASEHFVGPPHWEWYILGYFVFAGLSGGSYALATLLRHWGTGRDEEAVRLGFLTAFPAIVVCPILLTLDLGQPVRFWHMMVDTTPGGTGLNFSYWSPMSVGVWALLLYGLFPTVSFLQTLVRDRVLRWPLAVRLAGLLDAIDLPFNVVGTVLGLFVASYTGVLLSVSNQPIWSDTWALGGLFLASGLSGAVALLTLLVRYRPAASASEDYLRAVDGYFVLLEVVLLVAFFVTIGLAGTLGMALELPWLLLWVLVVLSLVPPLTHVAGARMQLGGRATAALEATGVAVPALVLVGVIALRMAVIFSAQF
ncbi:MAG: polysulfide reductase NrfD, partial [Candidatus Dormibacteraeota bacterium]|nr:polysulfide reductase NrfD [Candidatus Dormibacteraeota bacterium]MBO0762575.1 polysulfide reductase NrfD [Candidatus Dormibacteraeota bacterium]